MPSVRVARALIVMLLLAVEASLALAPVRPVSAQSELRDYPIPGGWFYSQEARVAEDTPPFRGYTVVDDADASLWTEFRRYGGVPVLGYPVTQRYRFPFEDGMWHQAFQRGILQWRAEEGRAHMANVYQLFTEFGLDEDLETEGIPRPREFAPLSFNDDAERRMTWITEPRFLARFFYDPVNQQPFATQEEAWEFLGLPDGFAERPVYYRERAEGKFGPPLYLPLVAQRFQKGALLLMLEDQPADPLLVPGDGQRGCLVLAATGRIARRIGAGTIIPGLATRPVPLDPNVEASVTAIIPPLNSPGQRNIRFELIGIGFQPGEMVTVTMEPLMDDDNGPRGERVTRVIDEVAADGSFDVVINARIGKYSIVVRGQSSKLTFRRGADDPLDLSTPTARDESGGVPGPTSYC
jgi:hypothetical protein